MATIIFVHASTKLDDKFFGLGNFWPQDGIMLPVKMDFFNKYLERFFFFLTRQPSSSGEGKELGCIDNNIVGL